MAGNPGSQRIQRWYGRLLRLYPRPFRDRFGEGMAQTFQDLCRERRDAGGEPSWFVPWLFFETLWGVIMENVTHFAQPGLSWGKTVLRVALGALALLMVPLVASRMVEGWNWPAGTFVFVYALLFGTGLVYALIARRMGAWSYKAGVGVALVAGFALGWSNMVHVAGSENPANLVYYSVLVVGGVGAWLARLEARGLARTLFAMAGLLAVIALTLPSGAPPGQARNMAILHGIFVGLLAASGFLFRHASLTGGAAVRPAGGS